MLPDFEVSLIYFEAWNGKPATMMVHESSNNFRYLYKDLTVKFGEVNFRSGYRTPAFDGAKPAY